MSAEPPGRPASSAEPQVRRVSGAEPELRPVSGAERIVSLDVLRGFAVLGILVMNVQSFSMIGAAYINPTAYGNLAGADYWVWYLGHLLTDQKFMTIFSMLFGAGIVLMWQRAERVGRKVIGLHYRRMGWLIVFGLLHAYLLWAGDILFLYGICGLFVFWARRWRSRTLVIVGVVVLAVSPALSLLAGATMPYWPEEAVEQFESEAWRPGLDRVAEEVASYQGGWLRQMESRVPAAIMMQTQVNLFWGLWRAAGLMLIGMAMFKLGVFSAERRDRFYWVAIALAVAVGLPVVAYGALRNFEEGWTAARFFLGGVYNYGGSLLVSFGWVGLVMLACKRGVGWFTGPMAAVGRMAFTNYLMQTIICTTIFYGHGLGWFGEVSRVGQILVVLGVWAVQIPFSVLWLRRFRSGPFEWLWRTLSYLRLQPFVRARAVRVTEGPPARSP